MEVVDKIAAVSEPQWILDRNGEGPLVWRRQNSEMNERVKFRYDVEVKEFYRSPHELIEPDWAKMDLPPHYNFFTMGLTCAFCISLTMLFPIYMLAD